MISILRFAAYLTNFAAFNAGGLAAAVAISVIRLHDPAYQYALHHERFWMDKVHGDEKADVVLVGDSRVYQGISPEEIEKCLHGKREVLNLGFSQSGPMPKILDLAERRLARKAEPPILIIGISPRSLTAMGADIRHYASLERRTPLIYRMYEVAPYLSAFLRPLPVPEAWAAHPTKYELHQAGWIACLREPSQAGYNWTLKEYRQQLQANPIEEQSVQKLMNQVGRLTSSGISVIGVRVPAAPEMQALENELLQFDESQFAARFKEAGGIWMEVDETGYQTYDATHLTKKSAVKFSHAVGKFLLESVVGREELNVLGEHPS